MTDRTGDTIYFRANFSSATTPNSGGKFKDAYGHEYASLPLQLPTNLIDNTRKPKAVDMLLTKLNIPVGSIPIARTGLSRISRDEHNQLEILTNGLITIWPFCMKSNGEIVGSYYYFPIRDAWPIKRMKFPLQSILTNKTALTQKLKVIEYTKTLDFFAIEDLMEYLSWNLDEVVKDCLEDPSRVTIKYLFTEKDSKMVLHVINQGTEDLIAPFSNQHEGSVYATDGQVVTWTTNATGQTVRIASAGVKQGFSIVVNKHVRDMFPRLPWREFNNDELVPVDMETWHGNQIPGWKDANEGDPMFYALDTLLADSKFVDNGILPSDSTLRYGMIHVRGIDYEFDGCNLISIVPVQAFVVMMSGIGITQQTYPVNVSPDTMSSALTSSIPIIEVYYPLWHSISDLSTNIIISKEAYSNAAPFTLDQNAMTQRDLRFTVYYILNDGTMNELTIPPGTSLSIQACFSIRY